MTGYVTFKADSSAYRGAKKPYVAKIIGLGGKFGFQREFLSNPARVFEPVVVVIGNVDKKDRRDSHFAVAVLDDSGDLHAIRVREETAVEILHSARPLGDLRCRARDGKWFIREDGPTGDLLWTQQVNPLAAYSDDDIRAEFLRRGL